MGGPETYLNNFTHAVVGTVKHYAAYGMSAGDNARRIDPAKRPCSKTLVGAVMRPPVIVCPHHRERSMRTSSASVLSRLHPSPAC